MVGGVGSIGYFFQPQHILSLSAVFVFFSFVLGVFLGELAFQIDLNEQEDIRGFLKSPDVFYRKVAGYFGGFRLKVLIYVEQTFCDYAGPIGFFTIFKLVRKKLSPRSNSRYWGWMFTSMCFGLGVFLFFILLY